ncbi:polysaccharide pyruvyl transferase family protein [Arthrobacter sp. I2-34]|uniref:Polysaccharide pyruvyl transferase family protein n=1 Tax=Arthrobacter hankyongi TaxID=2904801 RepID=A0ABS9L6F1_9MICC|nr:polysaccharide pyruvyl transferase family protein [Arthrobacter hankyongi]MCG2622262.1 polysaccharide pyruvyl transferase family protein [Arthrobacter hankyongi]
MQFTGTPTAVTALRSQARRLVRAYGRITDPDPLRTLQSRLGQRAAQMPGLVSVKRHSETCVCLDFTDGALAYAFDLRVKADQLELSALGRGALSKRVLRSSLVGLAPMVRDKGERHVLARWPGARSARPRIVQETLTKMQWLANLLGTLPNEANPHQPVPAGHVLTYWWDLKPNFGDTIGPWLVGAMTGSPVVNSKWTEPQQPSLFTVGSVVGHLNVPGHQLWGSGIINQLGTEKAERIGPNKPAAIHAVRGRLTRHELTTKLGWDVPEVYGDPALLLPRFLEPAPSKKAGKIAIVPHYSHKAYFAGVKGPQLNLVNVGNGLERVVAQIAGASHCISTSLHGIIIAHAYGVPWTWLRIGDHALLGDTFKFEDFFSVLEREEVSEAVVAAEQLPTTDFVKLAQTARRPADTVSLDPLQDSFPGAVTDLN